jgi:hypothetical protein
LVGFSGTASACESVDAEEPALGAGCFDFLSSPEPNIEKGYLSYAPHQRAFLIKNMPMWWLIKWLRILAPLSLW